MYIWNYFLHLNLHSILSLKCILSRTHRNAQLFPLPQRITRDVIINNEVLTLFPCPATNTGDDEVTTPDVSDAGESKEVSEGSGSIWKGNQAIYHVI